MTCGFSYRRKTIPLDDELLKYTQPHVSRLGWADKLENWIWVHSSHCSCLRGGMQIFVKIICAIKVKSEIQTFERKKTKAQSQIGNDSLRAQSNILVLNLRLHVVDSWFHPLSLPSLIALLHSRHGDVRRIRREILRPKRCERVIWWLTVLNCYCSHN